MDTKRIFRLLMGMMFFGLVAAGLTSCDVDDDWYDDGGGFYDDRLSGYWELVQYNSEPVDAGDVNYLYFGGRGQGWYYYLERGQRFMERTYYDCQYSNSGTSDYQINLQYGSGRPTTINYWFTHGGDTLWMQWRTGNGRVVTYVYDRTYGAPW